MKKIKRLLLVALVLLIVISGFPMIEVKAAKYPDNSGSDFLYAGDEMTYNFALMEKIQKVTYSNKKVASTIKIEGDSLRLKANTPGKTTITIKGKTYTYKLKLTVKKPDVTATLLKKLPNGKYLIKLKNNTKEGFFESVSFAVVLKSSDGEFLALANTSVSCLNPGATVYSYFVTVKDCDADLSKSTLELKDFEIDTSVWTKYTDCTPKMKVTDAKKGIITPSDRELSFKIKNNSANVASTYYSICWYDENGEVIGVDDEFYGDLSQKEETKVTVYTPDEKYNAASYSISVRAFSKVNISKPNNNFDIPVVD